MRNISLVLDVATPDFPFVAELPKRERSRWATVWDHFEELSKAVDVHGMLVPPRLAAKVLGVSTARISQLMQAGKLERVEVDGHPFLTENSVRALAQTERKAGRPFKHPTGIKESWQAASDFVHGK